MSSPLTNLYLYRLIISYAKDWCFFTFVSQSNFSTSFDFYDKKLINFKLFFSHIHAVYSQQRRAIFAENMQRQKIDVIAGICTTKKLLPSAAINIFLAPYWYAVAGI